MKQDKFNNPSKINEHKVTSPMPDHIGKGVKNKGNNKYIQFRRRMRKELCR